MREYLLMKSSKTTKASVIGSPFKIPGGVGWVYSTQHWFPPIELDISPIRQLLGTANLLVLFYP